MEPTTLLVVLLSVVLIGVVILFAIWQQKSIKRLKTLRDNMREVENEKRAR
jgi:preprotein translocase subunit YajC